MKFPLSWLKKFVPVNKSPEEVAQILTLLGIEVDKIVSEEISPGTKDSFFEVSLTPNLAHAFSLLGIAREWSAVSGETLAMPPHDVVEKGESIENRVTISVDDPLGCPQYACRLIRNVQVGPSPDWLQKALQGCGIRSVNNVVDVTNYVLMERGHPLHAFDYDKIAGHSVYVRCAYEGETFRTLDGVEHTLTQDIVMIADKEKPIAVGGVMGGENTEVGDGTRNIFLEGAYFQPHSIRLASKHLGLQTEASRRFERGVDPNGILHALDRAAELIRQVAEGEVAQGVVIAGEKVFSPKKIVLRVAQVERALGIRLSQGEMEEIFIRLGFSVVVESPETLFVTVPTYRVDVEGEIDLLEELARLYGYDAFPRKGQRFSTSTLQQDPLFLFEREVRARCVGLGLQEWLTCDLIGPSLADIVRNTAHKEEGQIAVINPTSVEQSVLRTSLLPGMMQAVKHNVDHQNSDIHAFEVGRVHMSRGEEVEEPSVVGMIFYGKQQPLFWGKKDEKVDFFSLKGRIEDLLEGIGVEDVHFASTELACFHPGRQASLFVESCEIGSMGEIHPTVLRRLGIRERVYFAELNLLDLMEVRKKERFLTPLPIYPCSDRDWTITLSKKIPIAHVLQAFREVPSRLLEKVSLVDIYESEKIGKGRHNLTFRMIYRDAKRTISQEVVEAEHQRLVSQAMGQIQ